MYLEGIAGMIPEQEAVKSIGVVVVFLFCRHCKNYPRVLEGARGTQKGDDIDFRCELSNAPRIIYKSLSYNL